MTSSRPAGSSRSSGPTTAGTDEPSPPGRARDRTLVAVDPLDDELDGCDIDMVAEADDDETASLRPLFPDGDPATAPEWQALADQGLIGPGSME